MLGDGRWKEEKTIMGKRAHGGTGEGRFSGLSGVYCFYWCCVWLVLRPCFLFSNHFSRVDDVVEAVGLGEQGRRGVVWFERVHPAAAIPAHRQPTKKKM